MTTSRTKRWVLAAAAISTSAVVAASPALAAPTDPLPARGANSATNPYLVPVAPGVQLSALLTTGDTAAAGNGYELSGIPDGLGAYRTGPNTATALVNHEIRGNTEAPQGIVRRHGQAGAYVSQVSINTDTLAVTSGRDFINPFDSSATGSQYFDYPSGTYRSTPSGPPAGATAGQGASFGRFCSGYLTGAGQLFNPGTGNGTAEQIYFANEEIGSEGRAFGVTLDGRAYQLPRLGLFSWENTVAAENLSDRTVVMGNDDSGVVDAAPATATAPATPASGGEVSVYVGTKTKTGNPFERAGLTNGRNNYIKISDAITTDTQFRAVGKNNPQRFSLQDIEWNQSGRRQSDESVAEGALRLNRVEDGAFDPTNRNDYYFLTTAGGPSRATNAPGRMPTTNDGGGLWRLRFDDVENPASGGTLTLLLDGSEGLISPDNMDIDTNGNLLIQEDPGGRDVVARILSYRIAGGQLATVAQFDPAVFAPGANNFTTDEESSGIIDTSDLFGPGTFLLDAQVHTASGTASNRPEDVRGPANTATKAEYVENGQLLLMRVSNFAQVYANGQPAPVIPEVPVAVAIPAIGLGVLGAAYVLRRRRPGIVTGSAA